MKKIILCITFLSAVLIADAQQQFAEEIPHATLAGKNCGLITLNEISMAGKLQSSNPQIQIVHFALTMINDGVLIFRATQGNQISVPMMVQLKQLTTGQKFIVDEISALNSNGQIIQLKPLRFTLN
jgi:hypothetical protein